MTSNAQQIPQHQAPHFGRWIKGVVALMLLVALAWVGMIALQYFQTGKPISEVAGVRTIKPLAKLVQEQPRFSASIWNVARPLGVATAPDGTVYVTESAGERMIRSFDLTGQPKSAFSIAANGKFASPAYVAVSPDGKIYATDLAAGTLQIFSQDGQLVGAVNSPVADAWAPMALTFDSAGKLYVTDFTSGHHRVLVFDPSGSLLLQFGEEGTGLGQFSFPNGIAVDAKGNIYVSDSGNGRVQAFDPTGQPLFFIGRGTGNADLAMPRGIAVDDGRNLLFVTDTTDGTVKVYDISSGKPKLAFSLGAPGTGAEELRYPNSVALDGKGHIYVADRENARVAVWTY